MKELALYLQVGLGACERATARLFGIDPRTMSKMMKFSVPLRERVADSAEKIRIVLEGVRGEASVAGLCRREGIKESVLPLVQRIPGGGQEVARGRCGA